MTYTNDSKSVYAYDYLQSKVLTFADDTQVFRTIKADTNKETLQNDLSNASQMG